MRRALLTAAALVCATLALLTFAAGGNGAQTAVVTPALVASGHSLFESACASCHGAGAAGIPGRAPSLHGVGALAADFYLETGRMPLPAPRAQPLRSTPAFPQRQIRALDAYVASFGGPAIPRVQPSDGSLAQGQQLFALDCAGCHSIQGSGGIVTGAVVPALTLATPSEIAEAVRIGPYVMPRFGAGELSGREIDSIARYVQSTQHPDNRGGWGIGRIGPIPEGMVAWLLAGAALLLIARLLGERTPPDGPRAGPAQ
jgi:ubiquinol-cytochrome c reductase cytochrome c subunit